MRAFGERNRNVVHSENKKNLKSAWSKSAKGFAPISGRTAVDEYGLLRFGGDDWSLIQSCELVADIYRYLEHIESRELLDSGFLERAGTKISGKNRQILVDWIYRICTRYQFESETFGLSVWLLDRATIRLETNINNYQLIGCVCFFLACKQEESFPISSNELIGLTGDLFTKKEFLETEIKVLSIMDYRLIFVSANQFVSRLKFCLRMPMRVLSVAFFIVDVALMSYALCHYRSSLIGAVAFYMATIVFNKPVPMEIFLEMARVSFSTIVETAREFAPYVLQFLDPNYKLNGILERYGESEPGSTVLRHPYVEEIKRGAKAFM